MVDKTALTDAELLAAWRGGNRAAGATLVRRHLPALERFFATKVELGVEDLVQTTFLACVQSRDTIHDPDKFRAHLFGIARYRLLMHFRDKGRRAGRYGGDSPSGLPGKGPTPSSMLRRRQDFKMLLCAMRRIATDLQIALELFYWERMSTDEIAQVLRIPAGTVKSRLWRAREQLKLQLMTIASSPEVAESTLSGFSQWASMVGQYARARAGASEAPADHAGAAVR